VVYYSGGAGSYFWVLYLLPVFSASLMASSKDTFGMVFLCSLSVGAMSWPFTAADFAGIMSLAVKMGVLSFSAAVVHSTAQSRKRAEAGLAIKRGQVELLEKEVTEKEAEIVKTASAVEVGTLVSGVMHDMGNAISVILLTAEIAATSDEPPTKKDLERILKGARYSRSLIAAAMSIVRGQDYSFEAVNLRETAESASILTDYAARKRNAAVVLDFPPGLPEVRGSRAHLERIFINTVSNSLSFVPSGGEVRVSGRTADGGVVIEVSDNGPGFPEKMLNADVKAFDTTRGSTGGTGLGLYVCERIAKKHGGWMKLSNGAGGGSLITIFLPLDGPAA